MYVNPHFLFQINKLPYLFTENSITRFINLTRFKLSLWLLLIKSDCSFKYRSLEIYYKTLKEAYNIIYSYKLWDLKFHHYLIKVLQTTLSTSDQSWREFCAKGRNSCSFQTKSIKCRKLHLSHKLEISYRMDPTKALASRKMSRIHASNLPFIKIGVPFPKILLFY